MHVKIRKRIGNPTLYNAKINYSLSRYIRFTLTSIYIQLIYSFSTRSYQQLISVQSNNLINFHIVWCITRSDFLGFTNIIYKYPFFITTHK